MDTVKNYYRLAKPGIVYGNLMHAIAAAVFAWALTRPSSVWPVVWMAVGLTLILASACVTNCITDRRIDARMDRTKKRPLPLSKISVQNAIAYAVVLFVLGSIILLALTNMMVWVCAVIGHVTYTALYGYVKRHSWTGTMVGTIPGAMPIFVGYASLSPQLSGTAWLLWFTVLLWQLPHFYALALYRRDDYAKSGLPIMSVVKPRAMVIRHIVVTAMMYCAVMIVAVAEIPLPKLVTGIMAVAALCWLGVIVFADRRRGDGWARKVFGYSLYMPIAMIVSSIVAVAVA